MVSVDAGSVASSAGGFLHPEEPGGFIGPGPFAPTGFGFPAAMGAKVAQPHRPSIGLMP